MTKDSYWELSNGRKIRYHKSGNATNQIIAMPGGPGLSLEYLQSMHEYLAKDEYEVYTYDLSGTATGNREIQPSVEAYSEELNEILTMIGNGGKQIVIGHSFSCAVAIVHAIEYRTASKYILMNDFGSGQSIREAITNRIKAFPSDFHNKLNSYDKTGDQETYTKLIMNYWLPAHTIKYTTMVPELVTSMTISSQSGLSEYYLGNNIFNISGKIMDYNRFHQLGEIKRPVLLISGKDDYFTVKENDQFASKFGNARLEYIDKTSHHPMLEAPEELYRTISDFLS